MPSVNAATAALRTILKSLDSSFHAGKDLVGCPQPVDANEFSLPGVVVQKGSRLFLKTFDSPGEDFWIIILAFAAEHPPHQFFARHGQLDDTIKAHGLTLKKLIKGRRLPERTGKAVQQAPLATIRTHQPLADHPNNQLIGHKLAALHETGRLLALAGLIQHRLPEHLTCGEMRNVQVLHEPLALRAFAGSRWPDKDDPHKYEPLPSSTLAARRGGVANVFDCRALQELNAGNHRPVAAQDFSSKPL